MLGMRISVQEYPAAFAEPIVKISVNALATLTRSMNDAFMASPFATAARHGTTGALRRQCRGALGPPWSLLNGNERIKPAFYRLDTPNGTSRRNPGRERPLWVGNRPSTVGRLPARIGHSALARNAAADRALPQGVPVTSTE